MTIKEALEYHKSIIEEAQNSESFKSNILANPKKAIAEKFPEIPKFENDVEIMVEDQSSSEYVYINIPRKVNFEDIVLSDEDLELVAGGATPGGAAAILTTVGCGVALGVCLIVGVIWGACRK